MNIFRRFYLWMYPGRDWKAWSSAALAWQAKCHQLQRRLAEHEGWEKALDYQGSITDSIDVPR